MKKNFGLERIASILFNLEEREKAYQEKRLKKKNFRTHVKAAERTLEKLEKDVKKSPEYLTKFRIFPKQFYHELKIEELKLSERSYVYVICALLTRNGLNLKVIETRSKSGRRGYWCELNSYDVSYLKQKLNPSENSTYQPLQVKARIR